MSLKKVFSWLLLSVLLSFGMLQSSVDALSFSGSGRREITSYAANNIQVANVGYGSAGMTSTWSWNALASINFRLYLESAIPANSVAYVTLNMSHINSNDTPLCFTGDQYSSALFCNVERSAYNDSVNITGLFYVRDNFNNLAIWNDSIVFSNSGSNVRVNISGVEYTTLTNDYNYSSVLNSINSGSTDILNKLESIRLHTVAIENTVYEVRNYNRTISNDISTIKTDFSSQFGNKTGDLEYNGSAVSNMAGYFTSTLGSKAYATFGSNISQFQYLQTNAQLAMAERLVSMNNTENTIANNTTNISNYANEQRQADNNISSQSASDIGGTTNAKTESLLSSAAGFATVLTNVNPSNCRINGNMGHFDIGIVDMCQDSPPSFITIIGSLVMVVILVGLSYALVNQILNLVKEMRT